MLGKSFTKRLVLRTMVSNAEFEVETFDGTTEQTTSAYVNANLWIT